MIPGHEDFGAVKTIDRVYRLDSGSLHVLVASFGGPCGSWGYLLWDGNKCVGGRKDWNWTAMDACERAKAALADYARANSLSLTT